MNFYQETPLILAPLTDRDFLQRASRDGYQKQPLTHAGGSEHLRSPQHQMRRLAQMKPDCRQQSSVCAEALETNLRRPDTLSQTQPRTLATTRLTQTDNISDVKRPPLSLLASPNLPEQICTGGCFDQLAVAQCLYPGVGKKRILQQFFRPSVCWRLAKLSEQRLESEQSTL